MPETKIEDLDTRYVYWNCTKCALFWRLKSDCNRCQKCGEIMTKRVRTKDNKTIEDAK